MKHSPAPWCIGRGPNGEVEIWGRMSFNASPILASMEHDPREANAIAIVRAVNSYDVMLDALQAVINWYGEAPHPAPPAIVKVREAISAAQRRPRAAAKVEG